MERCNLEFLVPVSHALALMSSRFSVLSPYGVGLLHVMVVEVRRKWKSKEALQTLLCTL